VVATAEVAEVESAASTSVVVGDSEIVGGAVVRCVSAEAPSSPHPTAVVIRSNRAIHARIRLFEQLIGTPNRRCEDDPRDLAIEIGQYGLFIAGPGCEAAAAGTPDAILVRIEASAHLSYLEAAEQFNGALARFLND